MLFRSVQRFKDQYDDALSSYQTALDLFRSVGSHLGEANTLASQSRLLVREGKIVEAEKKLQEAIILHRQIQDPYDEGSDNSNFAIALLEQKEFAKATLYAQAARLLFQKIPLPDLVEWTDQLLAEIQKRSRANPDSKD